MEELLQKAVEKYSKSLVRRMNAKKKLHEAQEEDRLSRVALGTAREALRTLEIELSENTLSPGLIPSSVPLSLKKTAHDTGNTEQA